MNWAFGRTGVRQIHAWLLRQPLLAFDFDGTLAPIVSTPGAAAMASTTAALLQQCALRHPCVVISGRSRADLAPRLAGIPVAEVIGNHGSEPWLDPAPLRQWTRQAVTLLRQRLGHMVGVEVEDKGVSLSVHYRQAFARAAAIAAVLEAAQVLGPGTLIRGKFVINLLPPTALHKGQALRRVMAQLAQTHAIYVGDDATDEHAFSLGQDQGVLGICVVRRRDSQATLFLKHQCEIDRLLSRLSRE
jgi:trehalose 6-phosphate phosphatase